MTAKTKILIVVYSLAIVILIGVIIAGVVILKNRNTSTKIPTAHGTVESGRGPLGPAKITKSTIPPISRVKVQITKNGFQPAILSTHTNTIIELSNQSGDIFYLQSTGPNKLNIPNLLPAASTSLEIALGYTGTYKLVNQKNSAQVLQITVKN